MKRLTSEEKDEHFYSGGISDRLLDTKNRKIVYMKFFESDEPYTEGPAVRLIGKYTVFWTRNGFHVIGKNTTTALGKRRWFKAWKRLYPHTDYRLSVENVLAPRSDFETVYIWSRMKGFSPPRIVQYYRDKAVFESLELDGVKVG